MILATHDDIEMPHIDWHCTECGAVYSSRGKPDETRCFEGHSTRWEPESDQMEKYIETLESLEVGDGILFAGEGPAALMAPVKEVGEDYVITESIDSPSRKIVWGGGTIKQRRMDRDVEWYDRVYHVNTVEIQE